jgi:hypothetical protein
MPFIRTYTAIVAALVLIAGMPSNASAQMFIATGRDTLRGLPGVEVAVENFEQDLERDGLMPAAALQADVARRLRAGGIQVYMSQKENPSEAKPYLYVDVSGVRLAGQALYAIAVQVQLRQTLRSPVTASNIVDAMTWDSRNVLMVKNTNLASVRDTVQESVDHFIRDWMAVHP